jgi:hypothetical protein
MDYMKRMIFYILPLLLIAGCATTHEPEPTLPQTEKRMEEPLVKQKPVPAEIKAPEAPQAKDTVEPEPLPLEPETAGAERPVISKAAPAKSRHLASLPHTTDKAVPEVRSGWSRLVEYNDKKLVNVYKGMDKATVLLIMKSSHNPSKREKITGSEGQIYEVLFYLTREPRKGKPITENLMTPVIIRNNEVVAIGKFSLKKLRTTGSVERKKRKASKS